MRPVPKNGPLMRGVWWSDFQNFGPSVHPRTLGEREKEKNVFTYLPLVCLFSAGGPFTNGLRDGTEFRLYAVKRSFILNKLDDLSVRTLSQSSL